MLSETFERLFRATGLMASGGLYAHEMAALEAGTDVADALAIYIARQQIEKTKKIDGAGAADEMRQDLEAVLRDVDIMGDTVRRVPSPYAKYEPRADEVCVVVGGCLPGLLGQEVVVGGFKHDHYDCHYYDEDLACSMTVYLPPGSLVPRKSIGKVERRPVAPPSHYDDWSPKEGDRCVVVAAARIRASLAGQEAVVDSVDGGGEVVVKYRDQQTKTIVFVSLPRACLRPVKPAGV